MLGRRAVVFVSASALAVTGGTALAATHGSSHSQNIKPQVHRTVRPQKVKPMVRKLNHCTHMTGAMSDASL